MFFNVFYLQSNVFNIYEPVYASPITCHRSLRTLCHDKVNSFIIIIIHHRVHLTSLFVI